MVTVSVRYLAHTKFTLELTLWDLLLPFFQFPWASQTALFYLKSRQGVARGQLMWHVSLLLNFSWVSTHRHSQSWQTESLQEISFSWFYVHVTWIFDSRASCLSLFLRWWKACGTDFRSLLPDCFFSTEHLVVSGEQNKERESFSWCLYSKRSSERSRGKESHGNI